MKFKSSIVAFLILTSNAFALVYDCFPFFNEIELLEVRLEELNEVVDYFVLVESKYTYTNASKDLYFEKNKHKFSKYQDKIIHLVIDSFPQATGNERELHWAREEYTRNYLINGLGACTDSDIIFLSDVDEIPSITSVREVVEYFNQKKCKYSPQDHSFICSLECRWLLYHLNREYFRTWPWGIKAVPFCFFSHYTPWDLKIFHHKFTDLHELTNAGWHFQSMGGFDRVVAKLCNTPPRLDLPELVVEGFTDPGKMREYIEEDILQNTHLVPVDETFPLAITRRLSCFEEMGWIGF